MRDRTHATDPLGLLIGFWGFENAGDHRLASTIGLLGGFTTFSTFALDTIGVWEDGRVILAISSVAMSVFGGLLAAVLGLVTGRALSG